MNGIWPEKNAPIIPRQSLLEHVEKRARG